MESAPASQTFSLTTESLRAHDLASTAPQAPSPPSPGLALLEGDDVALHSLLEHEASIARQGHAAALRREFEELRQLSAAEASGWQQRRERAAALRVQSMWRRRNARLAFLRLVRVSVEQRRFTAAAIIQRAQRTRRRVVNEAAPPISKEMIGALQKEIVDQTLASARELRAARAAQVAWYVSRGDGAHDMSAEDSVGEGSTGVAAAAAKAAKAAKAGGGAKENEGPPSLPDWLEKPKWEGDLKKPLLGPPLVRELQKSAQRGLHADDPAPAMVQGVREWPSTRSAVQAAAVRRQVSRTHAAALHAQLRHPPPLPPAVVVKAKLGEGLSARDELPLAHLANVKQAVVGAHRRAIQQARYAVDAAEKNVAAPRSPRASGLSTRASPGGAAAALDVNTKGISPAEALWLASLEPESVA